MARRPGSTSAATPSPAWPWGWAAWWPPWSSPGCSVPFTPGRGRYGKAIVAAALGAVAVTTVADQVARRSGVGRPGGTSVPTTPDRAAGTGPTAGAVEAVGPGWDAGSSTARKVASVGGVAAVVVGGIAVTTGWASITDPDRMWRRRLLPTLGTGPAAVALAVAGWDFIYYWNHRFMHESRYMWAMHVVHHSSERYNLSTALRQPVADALGTILPYGRCACSACPPSSSTTARSVNLLYQFWIHTETIDRIGATRGGAQHALAPPRPPRLEPPVPRPQPRQHPDRVGPAVRHLRARGASRSVYGLTKNIDTFNPGTHRGPRVRRHPADVARSTSWRERLSYVVARPGVGHPPPGRVEVVGRHVRTGP